MNPILKVILDDLVNSSLIAIRGMQRIDAILANPARYNEREWAIRAKQEFRNELDNVAYIFQTTLGTE
jgi:hypothetical protein